MSINGVLEDLPLADVLQFIHLGRRTGTLYMWQGEAHRAEIGFHDGRIIAAWTPRQQRLGDLLVSRELVGDVILEDALLSQRTEGEGKSIGQILVERGAVTQDDIYGVIRDQIQKTIFDLVGWRHGYFQFEVDELHPSDDFGLEPAELLENLDLNTQMLVLEATRLFDERHRDHLMDDPRADDEREMSRLDAQLERAGLGRSAEEPRQPPADSGNGRPARPDAPDLEAIRCQVVSGDPNMVQSLAQGLPAGRAKVVSVPVREAGNRVPGEGVSPLVVLDLREGGLGAPDVATLTRTRPAAPVVALVASAAQEAAVYEAGALAVVAPDRGSVVDCCRNLIRVLTHPQPRGGLVLGLRGGFSRFRRVVFDVQSGLASATMALNLMHLISDSVERAVLFLVHDDELAAVGAFGFSSSGEPLAGLTSGLQLKAAPGGCLEAVIQEAEPRVLDFDTAGLPLPLSRLVGRPASGQVVLFPVLGARSTISVIYTDNGALDKEIEDVELLELAASQVGMAFENELLRQEIGSYEFDPDAFG